MPKHRSCHNPKSTPHTIITIHEFTAARVYRKCYFYYYVTPFLLWAPRPQSRSTGETFPPGPMFSRGEHPSLRPAVGLLRGRNMVGMKRPPILHRLGTLFLVSLTSQYTFAKTQPDSFITSLDWHTLPLALLARPLTHTYCQQLAEHPGFPFPVF